MSAPGDSGGLEARRAALCLVAAALDHRGGLDEALAAPSLGPLETRDRAFARALAMTVLRRLGALDRALDKRLQRPPPEPVRALLRLGAAQLLYMETAPFAAVSTSVELAGADKATRPFKGLINAILRGLGRDPPDPAAHESVAPEWLSARWRNAYGPDAAGAISAMIAEEPATDLTFRSAAEAEAFAPLLEAMPLGGGSWRTNKGGDLAGWPSFAEGAWWVQDASAAIPARLLETGPGQTALDLCAAPGGKTLQLAATGATVTAVDLSASRLKRVTENLARTGLSAEIVVADAGAWSDQTLFDAVLLDAPCTATGTFRRHPEVLWLSRAPDVGKLAAVQARLLESAASRVRPGGRLVYCVCSLEPEEGEQQIERLLRRRGDLRLDPIVPGEGGSPEASLTPSGTLRILPHHRSGGTDGFFAARLKRV